MMEDKNKEMKMKPKKWNIYLTIAVILGITTIIVWILELQGMMKEKFVISIVGIILTLIVLTGICLPPIMSKIKEDNYGWNIFLTLAVIIGTITLGIWILELLGIIKEGGIIIGAIGVVVSIIFGMQSATHKLVKNDNEKTRNVVREEHQKTRNILTEMIKILMEIRDKL